jgi:hypothetical protein
MLRGALAIGAVVGMVAALAAPAPAFTAASGRRPSGGTASAAVSSRAAARGPEIRSLDTRDGDAAVVIDRRTRNAQDALGASLGTLGVVEIDDRSGTPRTIARLDGFLTRRSDASPTQIALGYVRAHLAAFGLHANDLDGLTLVRDYTDILGTHHLVWQQRLAGIPVFDDDLRAAVTSKGRLAWIGGAPLHTTSTPSAAPRVSASTADAAVRTSVDADVPSPGREVRTTSTPARTTAFARGDTAHLVWFGTSRGPVLGWQVDASLTPTQRYLAIVDAAAGRVLWRANQIRYDDVQGQGLAWGYYPSDLIPGAGGTQQPVTFPVADASALSGNNAHVVKAPFYRHPDEIPANEPGGTWNFPAVLDTTTTTGLHCTPHWACTWDSRVPYSWRTNMKMAATQLYFFLNTYHDHLEAAPIGFTEAAGNFQLVNFSGEGLGGDALEGFAELDAGIDHGLPDGAAWNAFFGGGADGESAAVYFLMFPANYANHIAPSSDSSIDASVVYHEYTHGLSTRLLFYADGSAALNQFDAYAMGEAWSDWYALDYLESQGFIHDTPADGDIVTGYFIQGGQAQPVRSEPMDCAVGSADPICPGGETGHLGGYTLGDFGRVTGYPEPHADGEIWSQTLWDLRNEIGVARAEMVVTRAMELSAPDPSFLDMRNSILLADRIAFGGDDEDAIWSVFANRGMGYFATEDPDRVEVSEDFSLPPVCPDECSKVTGTVVDALTGEPLAGARVTIPLAQGVSTTTKADGSYELRQVPTHVYPELTIETRGYEPFTVRDLDVSGTVAVDAELYRDWAASISGAHISSVTGQSYSGRCAPRTAIDLRFDTGWVTRLPRKGHRGNSIVVQLPRAIDVSSFGIDTAFGCYPSYLGGAVRVFRIETRTAHGPWRTAFHQGTRLEPGEIHTLVPRRGRHDVRAVRLTLIDSRSGYSAGMTELTVRGMPST